MTPNLAASPPYFGPLSQKGLLFNFANVFSLPIRLKLLLLCESFFHLILMSFFLISQLLFSFLLYFSHPHSLFCVTHHIPSFAFRCSILFPEDFFLRIDCSSELFSFSVFLPSSPCARLSLFVVVFPLRRVFPLGPLYFFFSFFRWVTAVPQPAMGSLLVTVSLPDSLLPVFFFFFFFYLLSLFILRTLPFVVVFTPCLLYTTETRSSLPLKADLCWQSWQ